MAGIFSLPPVILRGPFFADKLPVELIFSTSLVIHVDLSVLVWFLSSVCVLWSLLASKEFITAYKASFICSVLGTIILILSPFIGDSNPIKNNYVPVLQNPAFFIGLALFASGVLLNAFLTAMQYKKAEENYFNFGIYCSAIIVLVAAICFAIAMQITPAPDGDFVSYYEHIFWGGGHVLQFTYTSCLVVVWLWMAQLSGFNIKLSHKIIWLVIAINLLIALPSPMFYLSDDVYNLFTKQMRHGGGIAALFAGGAVIWALFCKKNSSNAPHAIKASLVLSVLLFGYGGVLGYMISGVNVTIPAHYHGSIVAVTLAFIALAYHLLPQVGFGEIKGKIATAQPYIYGIGQVMHVTGLAWMGGYGALRKAANSSQDIEALAPKLLFFSGGALAILGGLLFIVVVIRSVRSK